MTLFDEPEKPAYSRELARGMLTMWLCNVSHLALGVISIAFWVGIYITMWYLPVALLYGVFLIVQSRRAGEIARSNGMIIALSITVLLSGACTGSFFNWWR